MKGPRLLVVAGVASGVGKTTITLGLLEAFRRRVVRPKNVVVGVGCDRGTAADEIVGAIRGVLREHGLSEKSVKTLATVDAKRDEAGLIDAAPRLGVPLVFCDKATLNAVPDVPNASDAPLKFVGVQGVAEPAALAVSGGRLVVEKVKAGNVTVAVAERPRETQ